MEKRRPAEQRNCSQPAAPRKEKHSAVFGQDKHQPSRSGVPAGTMDWVRPRCLQEVLGLEPGNPAHQRLDRPFPLQTPSGGSPTLTPYRSMTPAGTKRKKGLTTRGPLQKGPVTEASVLGREYVREIHHACRDLSIDSNNEQWFSAAKFRLTEFFDERKTGYDWLHRPAVYDVLLAVIGLPIAVWMTVRLTSVFKEIDSMSMIPRTLVYIYIFYLTVLLFRLLFSYARWAFPKVEASSNIEAPQIGHRLLLGGIVLSIVGSFAYDVLKTMI